MYRIAEGAFSQPIDEILDGIEVPPIPEPAEALPENKRTGAVILTVPGIKSTSVWNYIFGKTNKDGVSITENSDGSLSENDKWLKEYFEIPTDEGYREFKNEVLEMAEAHARYSNDAYLEMPIFEIPGFAHLNLDVKTYVWSRDALDSAEALPGLMEKIEELSDKAEREGKLFYIFSHSWGTMLSHTALHRLSRAGKNIKVATWITCGSPLVPSNKIVRSFANHMISRGGLERNVSQPANVLAWVNVWGKHDMISNEIKQCPINYEMDVLAKGYEKNINFWSVHGIPDWIRMKNPLPWHSSYYQDFHTYLRSLKTDVNILVFEPYIRPSLMK